MCNVKNRMSEHLIGVRKNHAVKIRCTGRTGGPPPPAEHPRPANLSSLFRFGRNPKENFIFSNEARNVICFLG
jgi:hypothetical protein